MKITEETFVIGDTHFWHKQILKYENRPFSNVEEMNNTIINNYNKVVSKHHKVIFLGDFCLSVTCKVQSIFNRLNGYKMIILGNHDRGKSNSAWGNIGFQTVTRYPIICGNVILSHEPLIIKSPYINIHAHTHSSKVQSIIDRYRYRRNICVSVERINYTPVQIKNILPNAKEKLCIID